MGQSVLFWKARGAMSKRSRNPRLIKALTPSSGTDVLGMSAAGALQRVTTDLRTLLEAVYQKGKKDGAWALSQSVLKHLRKTEGFEIQIRGNGTRGVEISWKATPTAKLGPRLISQRDSCHKITQEVPSIAAIVHSAVKEGAPKVRQYNEEVVIFDGVSVDFGKMEIRRNGERVFLTAKEFKTLKFLAQNAERVITRDELLNDVWGYKNYPTTRTVDNHILKLRKKLETDPGNPLHFLTVHGLGYKFVR
jgi:DNA-binding winged helix-turn-helix (wHTH) protein